jgi:SAM-dependent methyltransferase
MRIANLIMGCLLFYVGSPCTYAGNCRKNLTSVLIDGYQSVRLTDLNYDESKIFKDPQDTETITAVGLAAIRPGDFVLDLGSGSGIPANLFLKKAQAAKVVGLDVSTDSVQHASASYGSKDLTFYVADYEKIKADQILDQFCGSVRPDIIVSNPPYVPTVGHSRGLLRTIDGGPYGLRYLKRVISIAETFQTRLAFIMGSYSSPLDAVRFLEERGYKITELTFTLMPFGSFSNANRGQILKLESEGKAFLVREAFKDKLAYVAIGIVAELDSSEKVTDSSLPLMKELLPKITRAKTSGLETISGSYSVPVRILKLDTLPN